MEYKEVFREIFSRKSSIAAIGIVALCYIATFGGGQIAVDQSAVSIVPVPQGPAAEQVVDWKIPAEITVITCLAIFAQGLLDYFRPRNNKMTELIDKIGTTISPGGKVE